MDAQSVMQRTQFSQEEWEVFDRVLEEAWQYNEPATLRFILDLHGSEEKNGPRFQVSDAYSIKLIFMAGKGKAFDTCYSGMSNAEVGRLCGRNLQGKEVVYSRQSAPNLTLEGGSALGLNLCLGQYDVGRDDNGHKLGGWHYPSTVYSYDENYTSNLADEIDAVTHWVNSVVGEINPNYANSDLLERTKLEIVVTSCRYPNPNKQQNNPYEKPRSFVIAQPRRGVRNEPVMFHASHSRARFNGPQEPHRERYGHQGKSDDDNVSMGSNSSSHQQQHSGWGQPQSIFQQHQQHQQQGHSPFAQQHGWGYRGKMHKKTYKKQRKQKPTRKHKQMRRGTSR